ncbi:hypothetical protein OG239_42220 (plasmid) [Streptomyces sp. NBC_00868]|uniref:hypothetical protein n=1 Tax=Streptomyces sp. NBC_00868 TaxID=2903683 RepID=UPI002F9167AC|nr:hypothetical protein OG239_42220 [Streptomyces sp. NBC_00868]
MIKNVALRTACMVLLVAVATGVAPQIATAADHVEAVSATVPAEVTEIPTETPEPTSTGEFDPHNPWG